MASDFAEDFLAAFNAASAAEAAAMLRPCVDIPRWCSEIAAARPFATPGELLSFAELAAPDWTAAEIDAALAHHPRIGERPADGGTEAAFSRQEQASVAGLDGVQDSLLAGNRAYEEKFGRVFLIRAAGRTGDEILASLRQRLGNTPEEEFPVIAAQLRDIAILRLEGLLSPATRSHITTHVLDTGTGKPAAGVAASLWSLRDGGWHRIGAGTTDPDGRIGRLGPEALEPGTYRIDFATGDYFAAAGTDTFFPSVSLAFTLTDPAQHYHVPLLLSPFAYSTYRGS